MILTICANGWILFINIEDALQIKARKSRNFYLLTQDQMSSANRYISP
ncbi:MAG: hypothetical protein HFE49_01685 [Clostridia bacterium]|nr:hypothetical protein [Clostridia bacterium]